MPRNARDILSFSEHWFRLVKACDEKRVVPMPYNGDGDYRAIMNEFYGFRKALKNMPEFADIYRKAGQVKSYRKDGLIHFHHVETGRYAHLLLDALGPDVAPAFVPPEKQAEPETPASDFVDNESDTVILMSKYFKEGGGKV